MTRSRIYIIIAGVFALIALGLAYGPPLRFGTYDDDIECGENTVTQREYTFAGYMLFNQPIKGRMDVGDCPYENFYAKTYAVELWVIAVVFALGAFTNRTVRERN